MEKKEEFELQGGSCPYCSTELPTIAAVVDAGGRPDASPSAGDMILCPSCWGPLVLTETLAPRRLEQADWEQLSPEDKGRLGELLLKAMDDTPLEGHRSKWH